MIGDLAMHIADLVANSLRARAAEITVRLAREGDVLRLEVEDSGMGIPSGHLARVTDPFFSTKPGAKVGLGLPLLVQTAEETGGDFQVNPRPGGGTHVAARVGWNHPDRPPLGDLVGTLVPLIAASPEVEFRVELSDDRKAWALSTREIRERLGDVPLHHPEVLVFLERALADGLRAVGLKEEA